MSCCIILARCWTPQGCWGDKWIAEVFGCCVICSRSPSWLSRTALLTNSRAVVLIIGCKWWTGNFTGKEEEVKCWGSQQNRTSMKVGQKWSELSMTLVLLHKRSLAASSLCVSLEQTRLVWFRSARVCFCNSVCCCNGSLLLLIKFTGASDDCTKDKHPLTFRHREQICSSPKPVHGVGVSCWGGGCQRTPSC